MVQVDQLVVLGIWLPQILLYHLTWIYWWQIKEYRIDRFKVLLKMEDGIEGLGIPILLLKLLLILFKLWGPLILLLVYVNFIFILSLLRKNVRRPVMTQRSMIMLATAVLFIFITMFAYFFWGIWGLLIGEFSLVFAPLIGIFLTYPVVVLAKKKEIQKAKGILYSVNPTVIGITGSYGKTTTKDFIAHLLSYKFRVEKTRKNENTVFGVVRKINTDFDRKAKFFVVEMGAYKKGEIASIAEIVRPSLAIITGIETQHLDIFGGIEQIKKAKFELIESLPQNSTVIFNENSILTRDMVEWAKEMDGSLVVRTYGTAHSTGMKIKKISSSKKDIKFKVSEGRHWVEFEAPFGVDFLLENLCGAILVCRLFKMDWATIKEGVKTLSLPARTMDVRRISNGAVIIDDTYNSTPKGFESALNYLKSYEGTNKAVITTGVIELGKETYSVHKKMGVLAGKICKDITLTNKAFFRAFSAGVTSSSSVELVRDRKKLVSKLDKLVEEKYVILLEGRLPSDVIKRSNFYK